MSLDDDIERFARARAAEAAQRGWFEARPSRLRRLLARLRAWNTAREKNHRLARLARLEEHWGGFPGADE